jgi:hypothetical protein
MSDHGPEVLIPEQDRLPYRTLSIVAVGALILFTIGGAWAIWLMVDQAKTLIPGADAMVPSVADPGSVRLDAEEIGLVDQTPFEKEERGVRMRARQQQRLGSYGWVSKEQGVVHLPIERAIELTAGEKR